MTIGRGFFTHLFCQPENVWTRLREWVQMGKEVFVYFNNDGEGNAVRNAFTLRGML